MKKSWGGGGGGRGEGPKTMLHGCSHVPPPQRLPPPMLHVYIMIGKHHEFVAICVVSYMQVTCRSHAGHMEVTCRSHAGHMQVTCRSHAGHMQVTAQLPTPMKSDILFMNCIQ